MKKLPKIKAKILKNKMLVVFTFLFSVFLIFTFFLKKDRLFFVESKTKYILDSTYYWEINNKSESFFNNKFRSSFITLDFDFEGYINFKDSVVYFCDTEQKECIGYFDFKINSIKKNYWLFDRDACIRSFKDGLNENYYFIKKAKDPFENTSCYVYVFSLKKGLLSEAKIDPFSKKLIMIIGNKTLIHNELDRINDEMNNINNF